MPAHLVLFCTVFLSAAHAISLESFIGQSENNTSGQICPGRWMDYTSDFYQHFQGITGFAGDYSEMQLRQEACPAETFMHNCFFHGDTARANMLIKRNWFSSDKNCIPFWPHNFLDKIKNKKLYFAGDSTMMQVWSQLFCSLYSSTSTEFKPFFMYHRGGTDDVHNDIYNSKTCPFGASHCHLTMASAWFPLINASMHFTWVNRYGTEQILQKIISHNKLSSQDIIIANVGIHYNFGEQQLLERDLRLFLRDIHSIKDQNINMPLISFLESLPQHFSGNRLGNGYYNREEAGTACADVVHNNISHAHAMDWRNRIVESVLGDTIPLIRIADALLSQYDTHLNGNNSKVVEFSTADCTHYCAPSGVFRYIHTMIYNTLLI